MGVTRFMSELRLDREPIERTIPSLDRFDRLSIEAAEVAAQSVPSSIAIPRCDEVSSKGRAAVKTLLVLEGNARSSVESNDSRVIHSTTPFSP